MLASMDCFIAIRIPPEIRMELMKASDALDLEQVLDDPDEAMPHSNSFHITVKHIGEIEPELLHKFHNEVFQYFQFAPFDITIGEFSVFENPKGDQIVHATVESPELHQLFAKLEKVAVEAGLKAHDFPSFKPHVTIAYVPKEKKAELAHEMTQIDTSMGFGKFRVSTLTIFEAFAKNDFSPVHEIALQSSTKITNTEVEAATKAEDVSDADIDRAFEETEQVDPVVYDHAEITESPRMNFCPHCGIDMRRYGKH